MSYAVISLMAVDVDLMARVHACAAQERVTTPNLIQLWIAEHFWTLCGAPDWAPAYGYCVKTNAALPTPLPISQLRPGWQDNVVTDGMILAAVKAAATTP